MASRWENPPMKNKSAFQLPAQKEAIWILSFSDMTLSLLCFFLLLLSFSHKNTAPPQQTQPISPTKSSPVASSQPIQPRPAKDLAQLAATLRKLLLQKKLDSLVQIDLDATGLHLEFSDGLLFNPTEAHPKVENKQALLTLISIIAPFVAQNRLKIEGHTDDTPLLPG